LRTECFPNPKWSQPKCPPAWLPPACPREEYPPDEWPPPPPWPPPPCWASAYATRKTASIRSAQGTSRSKNLAETNDTCCRRDPSWKAVRVIIASHPRDVMTSYSRFRCGSIPPISRHEPAIQGGTLRRHAQTHDSPPCACWFAVTRPFASAPEDRPLVNSRCIKPPINLLLHPQRHGHRSRLISLALEIQKHPAAVAHREMIAVRARQFPAEQCARHQYRQQRGSRCRGAVSMLGVRAR